jgi:DNA-binding MarR family transcriptional regulator
MADRQGTHVPHPDLTCNREQEGSARAVALALTHLLRTLPRLKAQIDARAQEEGLHASSTVVLRILIEAGPQRSSAIAGALDLDPSWISRQVNHLVQSGLVERRVDPRDGRAIILAATGAGEDAYAQLRQMSVNFLARKVAHWADADRARLAVLLDQLAGELEAPGLPVVAGPLDPRTTGRGAHD